MDKPFSAWDLGPGERELDVSRFSIVSLYAAVASGVILAAGSLLASTWLWRFAEMQDGRGAHLPSILYAAPGFMAKWLLPALALIGAAHVAMSILRYSQEYIVLTNRRLLLTSLFGMNDRSIILTSLRNINKSRSLFGMLFGYGTISIQDTSEDWIIIRFVNRPNALMAKISNASSQ